MSSKLSFTDINAWYTSLNTLRNKENIGMGDITIPSLNKQQVRATDINDYINQLNSLQTNEYFRYADWISISTVGRNDQIKEILKTNINTELNNLNKVCANNSVTSQDTTNSTNIFSTSSNATNATCSRCITFSTRSDSTCSTYSTHRTCTVSDGTITQFVFSDRGQTTGRCGITFGAFVCGTNSTNSFNTNSDQTTSSGGCFTSSDSTNTTRSCKTITYVYNFSVVSDKPIISHSKNA